MDGPFNIQRPLDWIARAFRLRAGEAPNRIDSLILPTIDATQGGIAIADWDMQAIVSAIATLSVVTIPAAIDQKFTRLVQLSASNPGVANALLNCQLLNFSGALGPVLHISNIPAANTLDWRTVGGGMMWFVVPPGYSLFISIGATSAGTASTLNLLTCTVPAGSKPW